MDETTNRYRLNESRQQDRLKEFQSAVIKADLSDSIALTKVLIEQAANANQVPVAKDLLAVLANLTKAHRLDQIKSGELLDKDALRRIGAALAQIVADELEDLPDFENRVDRISQQFCLEIERIRNDIPSLGA